MVLEELIRKLKEIKNLGFISSRRFHDGGVGNTLEDLLELKENNLSLPDLGKIELKAKRIKSESMLTIVTKSPEPKGINRVLFKNYKYKDIDGYEKLNSTVYGSRENPQGFRIIFENDKIILKNKKNIEVYWLTSIFDDVLKSKAEKILLIFAETKGERNTPNEKFHYIEAHLLSGLSVAKFKRAIEHDKLKIDIRIGLYMSGKNKGKFHDHGTAFRINKRDFLELFDNYQRLI